MDDQEDHNNVRHGEEEETGNQTETTFGFLILDTTPNVNMKNIPLSTLPTFYGKNNEDPDTFLFEFDILCRSYNYVQDAQKLKLFPATALEKLLHIEFSSLCPSSLNIVFSPQALPLFLRGPLCLFLMSLPLVED
jgi:hypothetical protein